MWNDEHFARGKCLHSKLTWKTLQQLLRQCNAFLITMYYVSVRLIPKNKYELWEL